MFVSEPINQGARGAQGRDGSMNLGRPLAVAYGKCLHTRHVRRCFLAAGAGLQARNRKFAGEAPPGRCACCVLACSILRPPEGFVDLLVRVGLRAADVPELRGGHPRELPAATRSSAPFVKAAVPSGYLGVSARRSCPAGATEAHDVPNKMQEGMIQTHRGSPLTYSLTVRLLIAKTDFVGHLAAGQ